MTRELQIDDVLRSWLTEGAERAPEHHLRAALQQVEATPQRRPRVLPRLDHPPEVPPSTWRLALGVMVVALLAALGLGIATQVGLIRLPPAPPPAPDARDARNFDLFSNPRDGYELLLPEGWEEIAVPRLDGEPAVGVRRFRAPVGSVHALTISVGDPNGTVRICDLACSEVKGQVSLDILEETLVSSPVSAGWREIRVNRVIGNEAARSERPNTGGVILDAEHPTYYHFFALHHGRPIVFAFDYWPIRRGAIDSATVDQIVDSFRFLRPVSDAGADESLAVYSYPEEGYEVTLPGNWEVRVPILNGEPVPGVRRFGSGVNTEGAMLIAIGDRNGSIRLCAPLCIEAVGLRSLDDLEGALMAPALVGPPRRQPVWTRRSDHALDGRSGRDDARRRSSEVRAAG
jgi:hypothetical protein